MVIFLNLYLINSNCAVKFVAGSRIELYAKDCDCFQSQLQQNG